MKLASHCVKLNAAIASLSSSDRAERGELGMSLLAAIAISLAQACEEVLHSDA